MESEAIDWEQDLPLDADEAYRSLVRSLRRTDGFALLFVRCSPVQGDRIITDVRADLPSKTVDVLELKESIDNLYDHVAALPNCEQINVLFIKGIEYSIFAYEDREMNDVKLRSQGAGYGGTWQGIPRILGHLNLSRERFRDNFKLCFVFLLPEFALRYFIRRAPDFFDWRSNIYEFPTDKDLASQEAYRLVCSDDRYMAYFEQTPEHQRIVRLSAILSYLEESPEPNSEASLWFSKGLLHLFTNDEYNEAISSFEKALQIKPKYEDAWMLRGLALRNMGRYEESIVSFDKVLQFKPDSHKAWSQRSLPLEKLDRFEEAFLSIDTALKFKPDHYEALFNRGVFFSRLGKHEEALISYDKVLEIHPSNLNIRIWENRGSSLCELGRYKEALASYDKVLEFNPNSFEALANRSVCLFQLDRYEEAIVSCDKVLEFNPNSSEALANRSVCLFQLDRYEEAIVSCDKVLEIKPDFSEISHLRGLLLCELGRYEEAFASYDKVLEINFEDCAVLNSIGWSLCELGRYEEAIVSFDKALEMDSGSFAIWFNRGWALDKLKKYDEAIFDYDKAFLSGIKEIGEIELLKLFFVFFSKLLEQDQEHIDTIFSRELESLDKKQELENQEIYARIRAFLLRIAKIREDIPKEEWQKSHHDFAKNIDFYLS